MTDTEKLNDALLRLSSLERKVNMISDAITQLINKMEKITPNE